MNRRLILAFLILLAGTASGQTILYVDDDADSAIADGSSWATAYKYLQDALAAAQAGDEVHVAQGIYRPDRDSANPGGTGDREASFTLSDSVTLKGGYAGLGDADPNTRDITRYKTILSGDLAGNDIEVSDPCDLENEPTRSENSANILMIKHVSGISLDGLTIRGGFANIGTREGVLQTEEGGGVHLLACTEVVINRCRFIDNLARFGGGVYTRACENVTVNDCLFLNNAAGDSGGAFVIDGSKIKVCRSRIEGNWSSSSGGGVSAGGEDIIIIDSILRNNRSNSGGGGAINNGILRHCVIKDNSAVLAGGVLCVDRDNELIDCTFTGNTASTRGGAIFAATRRGKTHVLNCMMIGNQALEGGALYGHSYQQLIIKNCTTSGNRADVGVFLMCDAPRVSYLGDVFITDSIIGELTDSIYTEDGSIHVSYTNLLGGMTSVIDPNNHVTWGIGNIEVDPLFADPGYWDDKGTPHNSGDDSFIEGDYHLQSEGGRWDPVHQIWVRDDVTSACIDAGDPNSPIGLEPFPNGGRVNMGAYGGTIEASKSYFGEPICETIIAGDINGDCRVDFADLVILVNHWLHEP